MKRQFKSLLSYIIILVFIAISCDFVNPIFREDGSLSLKCIIDKNQLDKKSDFSSPQKISRIKCIIYKGSDVKEKFDLTGEGNKFNGSVKIKKGTYDVRVEAYNELEVQTHKGSKRIEVSPLKTTEAIVILVPNEFTLTTIVNPSNSGSISINPIKSQYKSGETVQLTASASPYFKFDHWEVDSKSLSINPVTIEIIGNMNVTAFFNSDSEIISTPITPSGPLNGTVGQSLSFSTGGATSNLGHSMEYIFNWGDGNLSNWGQSTQSHVYNNVGVYQIKAQARCQTHTTVVSNWSKSMTISISGHSLNITINPPGLGNVTKNPKKDQYNHNEIVYLRAAPFDSIQYQFDRWEGDLSGANNPINITMNGSKNIITYFRGQVATPYFNPPEGTYSTGQNVTITSATPGAAIHYTTNGIDPKDSDTIYSNPIYISTTTTLKAKAYKSGLNASNVKTGIYYIDDGLVAYYPFNGNANDESGKGNHGTVYGAKLNNDRFVKSECAYNFDGIDDYILVPNSASLNLKNALTISAWVNFSMIPTNGSHILMKSQKAGTYEYGLNLNTQNSRGISASIGGSNIVNVVTNTVTENNWYHVVATWQYPGLCRIYLNGVHNDSTVTIGNIDPINCPLTIGRIRPGESGSSYNGIIDDIRIYNRVLSKSEIEILYHEGGWKKF